MRPIPMLLCVLLMTIALPAGAQTLRFRLEKEADTTTAAAPQAIPGMPALAGGGSLPEFIRRNLRYTGRDGTVTVAFGIDPTGGVKDPVVIRPLNSEADEDALRIVRLLQFTTDPSADPNRQYRYTVSVQFFSE